MRNIVCYYDMAAKVEHTAASAVEDDLDLGYTCASDLTASLTSEASFRSSSPIANRFNSGDRNACNSVDIYQTSDIYLSIVRYINFIVFEIGLDAIIIDNHLHQPTVINNHDHHHHTLIRKRIS